MRNRILKLFSMPLAVGLAVGCQATPEPETPEEMAAEEQEEQALIESSAEAFTQMRSQGRYRSMEAYLADAKGIMVFPRVLKGSFVVGGQGGSGVMLTRTADGTWSDPAFYNIGGGSAGLQIGYEEATMVFFYMSDGAVQSAVKGGFTLGSDATLAAGTVGSAGAGAAGKLGADIVQFVSVGGLAAGFSLNGAVLSADEDDNEDYYGAGATPRSIMIQDRYERPEADVIKQALAPRPSQEPRAAL